MSYDNNNRGSLGKNKRKTEDTHPEYSGQINIEGVEYWLSAWVKTNGETGEKFFSISAKAKEAKKEAPKPKREADFEEMAGDIPF